MITWRLSIIAVFILAGCAAQQPRPIANAWTPTAPQWDQVRYSGTWLNRPDGTRVYLHGDVTSAVLTVKYAIETASGVKADLVIVETEQPNAFATTYNGKPVIALSLSYLDRLGRDRDALATTIGHEMAHLKLGHSGAARKEREDTAQGAGMALGTVANMVIPFSGYLVSAASTAYARSFTRDEERAADDLGIQWAVAAGYDPCGKARMVEVFSKLQGEGITLLSTHPSYGERSELANDYAMKAIGKSC